MWTLEIDASIPIVDVVFCPFTFKWVHQDAEVLFYRAALEVPATVFFPVLVSALDFVDVIAGVAGDRPRTVPCCLIVGLVVRADGDQWPSVKSFTFVDAHPRVE